LGRSDGVRAKWSRSGDFGGGRATWGRLLGLVLWSASPVFAQSAPQSAPAEPPAASQPASQPAVERERTGTLSASEIEKLIAQVDASTDSSAAQKEETKNLLRQALDQIRLAESWEAKIAESQARILAAPEDLRRFRSEIEQFTPTSLPATQDDSIEVLTSRLNAASTELRNAQSALEKLNADAETRRDRREQLARLIEAANANMAKAQAGLDQPNPPGQPASLIQARRVLWQEQQAAYRNEIRAYEEELRELSARADVFESRRELQRRIVADQERIVAEWQERVDRRRQQEIQEQNQQIGRELEQAPGPLREIAEATAATVADRAKAGEAIKRLGELIARIEAERASFSQRFAQTQQTVAEAAFTELIGPEVAKLRSQLGELRNYSRELRARERELSAAVQRQVRLEEQRSGLRDMDALVASVMSRLPAGEASRPGMQARVKELLRVQRESLDQLYADYGT
jgi:chromosome segregation ATPase